MTDKIKTVSFGQVKDYAKVADRINEFRQANPNGLIETEPAIQADGSLMFKAHILKDKSNPASGEATGHAYAKQEKFDKEKGFEKLETIAVGRALALLGYSASGEVASSEEMEEFIEYQEKQKQDLILEWTGRLSDAKTLPELANLWADVPGKIKKEVEAHKTEMKTRLTPVVKKPAKIEKPPVTSTNEPEHENK